MKFCKEMLLLYAVTDRSYEKEGESLYQQIEQALKGGVTMVQLREKHLSKEEFYKEALEIKELCHKYQVPLLINDDVELAIACDADGVHVGQKDMEAGNARKLMGKDKILGVTAKTIEQANAALEAGADYIGVGAMFPTTTKLDALPMTKEGLEEIHKACAIPKVAIGGITRENLETLEGCPVDGVALVSAIFSAENIEQECKKLRSMSEKLFGKEG